MDTIPSSSVRPRVLSDQEFGLLILRASSRMSFDQWVGEIHKTAERKAKQVAWAVQGGRLPRKD
jgi:hypothetical protein